MSKRILLVGLILGVIGLALAGCMRLTSLVVAPASKIVEGGDTVTFIATDHLGNPVAVIWSVSSSPGTGTITSAGVYTAPPAVSVVTNATITATRVGYPSITGFATVTIEPPITAGLIDAVGDAFGLGTYDITGISTSRTSTTLTVTINLTASPTIPAPGMAVGPGDLAGFICFDTDEIVATGIPSANFYFCPCGPVAPAIGSDYFVSLFFVNAAGNYDIYKTPGFTNVGDATYALVGTVLTLTIPLADLGGDDGITDMNAVLGDAVGPTDCIPDEVAAVVTGKSIVPAAVSPPYYVPFLLATYGIPCWGTSIAVTKTADLSSVQSGSTVVFTVRVENTGVRAVTLTSLIDDLYDLTGVQTTSCAVGGDIAVGDSYECKFEVVVTGNSGESTDTVTAKAKDDDENEVTASGKATVTIE
ncbi:hypothetical protein KAX17_15835 [Candidatus Bipolaricaulota bacterium]|nr:hypothetical protein [Candidatus Bipolaricaulota bacterium]